MGCLMIFMGLGCKAALSSMLIYIISFFREQSPAISLRDSAVYIHLYSLPAAFCALLSIRASRVLPIHIYFRLFCILDVISYGISVFVTNNYYLFLLFYSWIPSFIAYGFMLPPLLKYVWDSFP